jgi:hypothetical protein
MLKEETKQAIQSCNGKKLTDILNAKYRNHEIDLSTYKECIDFWAFSKAQRRYNVPQIEQQAREVFEVES